MRVTLARTEDNLSRTSEENQQLLQQHTEFQQQNRELTGDVAVLQERFTETQAENDLLAKALQAAQSNLTQLGEEKENSLSQQSETQALLATTEETLSRVSAENQQLLQNHAGLQQRNQELMAQVEELQHLLTDREAANVRLVETSQAAQGELVQLGQEKEDFLQQQAELSALLAQERQTVEAQNQQVEEAIQSSQELREDLDKRQA